jgi:hypothetical protein
MSHENGRYNIKAKFEFLTVGVGIKNELAVVGATRNKVGI